LEAKTAGLPKDDAFGMSGFFIDKLSNNENEMEGKA
jgi:hypothetical protein